MQEERVLKQNTRRLNTNRIMKKVIVYPGEIFCIPLFMPKDDWNLKKLSDEDLDKEFAFGRVIETSSSVLVEIFKKIGSAKTSISEIVNSGILFSPLQIFLGWCYKKTVENNRQNRKLR